jgi:hypothetical protein
MHTTKNGGDTLSLSADLSRDVALHESGYGPGWPPAQRSVCPRAPAAAGLEFPPHFTRLKFLDPNNHFQAKYK